MSDRGFVFPRLAPGGQFGASLAANDRRLLHATFEIRAESDHAGFVNALPMLHSRWMPVIESDGGAAFAKMSAAPVSARQGSGSSR